MNTNQKKLLFLPLVFAVVCLLVTASWSQPRQGGAAPAGASGAAGTGAASDHPSAYERLSGPKLKFHGSLTCNDVKCHGAAKPNPVPHKYPGDEYTKWARPKEGDKHNKAYRTLNEQASKDIAKKLNIEGAPNAAPDCLKCHALNAPPNMRIDLRLQEGVTCTACHGPSQKWLEPHKKEGWGNQVRANSNHDQLLQQVGLYDTRPPVARAELCVSCHLKIEANMVAAGHPQPVFELAYYTDPYFYTGRHWRDPPVGEEGAYYATRLWSAGQIVSLRDALRQLATRAKADEKAPKIAATTTDAYQQALGHYLVLKPFLAAAGLADVAKGLDAKRADLDAAVKAGGNAKVAAAASAMADTADGATDAVDKVKPDKAITLRVLQDVARENLAKSAGAHHAREQQSFAIYSLYGSHATTAKLGAEGDKVLDLMGEKLFPPKKGAKMDAKVYDAGLAAIRPKLPAAQ